MSLASVARRTAGLASILVLFLVYVAVLTVGTAASWCLDRTRPVRSAVTSLAGRGHDGPAVGR